MNKFVIVAPKRTGKTTLVNKILACTNKKVCGFKTSKDENNISEDGYFPLYIYPVDKEIIIDEKHCVGYCGRGKHEANNDVFNTIGVDLITASNKEELIIMDEVGFMETEATLFKEKILEVLSSNNPVIVMLKDKKNVEFLEEIKALNGIELINMNINNRDEVFKKVKESLR